MKPLVYGCLVLAFAAVTGCDRSPDPVDDASALGAPASPSDAGDEPRPAGTRGEQAVTPADELPPTAGALPLIAALAGASLGSSLLLRWRRTRRPR